MRRGTRLAEVRPGPTDISGNAGLPNRDHREDEGAHSRCSAAASFSAASAILGPGVTNSSPISRYTR